MLQKRRKILIICLNNAKINPRPNRMVKCLKDNYDVSVACHGGFDQPGVKSIAIKGARDNIFQKIEYLLLNIGGKYELLLESKNYSALVDDLKSNEYAFIVSHDLIFLPILKKYKKNAKVMLDAREYYPRQYEDKFIWRLLYKKMYEYFCDKYLRFPDVGVTVSEGIANEYEKVYGVKYDVLLSWPDYHDLWPTQIDKNKIRIIHHGNAFPSRKIEKMIEMMGYVDDRFSLDLMLVNRDKDYYQKLVNLAAKTNKVRIIQPVPFHEIVTFCNQYDVGLYLTEPGSFNIRHMLPNKFFEFVQSRLAIAIGPSIEMKVFVEKYKLGLVADDFLPQSLANLLNTVTAEQLTAYKENSHQLAGQCNSALNCEKINKIVRESLAN